MIAFLEKSAHQFLRRHYPHQVQGFGNGHLSRLRFGTPLIMCFYYSPPCGIVNDKLNRAQSESRAKRRLGKGGSTPIGRAEMKNPSTTMAMGSHWYIGRPSFFSVRALPRQAFFISGGAPQGRPIRARPGGWKERSEVFNGSNLAGVAGPGSGGSFFQCVSGA